jgi:hypothetical protein
MMVYGVPGSGKTTLAATTADVPHMRDVLMIDAESGSLSISDRNDLDIIRIANYTQMSKVHEYLRLHCRHRDENNLDGLRQLESRVRGVDVQNPRKYRTVIIDSLTEVQKYCMYHIMGVRIGDRQLDVEPDTPEFKQWGQSSEMIRLLVRSFRDLPMNVIFVASEMTTEDEAKRQLRSPNLPGKLSSEVQGFLDVVGHLQVAPGEEGKVQRRLYLQPGRTFQAKNRFASLKVAYIDSPNIGELINAAGLAPQPARK